MKESRTLKKKLGLLKYRMIDCWPYIYHVKKAASLREKYRKLLPELPPLALSRISEIEIHMLCGKGQIDMGIWASWSLMRFLDAGRLFVHSDGTLFEEDMALWNKIIPTTKLITQNEANLAVENTLRLKCPHLYQWRCENWCGSQVVDPQFFGNSKMISILDSDILCFRDPLEFKESVRSSGSRWNKDLRDAYSISNEFMQEQFQIHMPEKFNAGFCVIPRMLQNDMEALDQIILRLKQVRPYDVNHQWSAQTYYAIYCAITNKDNRPLGTGYDVVKGRTRNENIIRHYVGIPSIRPRYFLEGIPRLLSQAGLKDS